MMKQLFYLLIVTYFSVLSCSKNNDILEMDNFSVDNYPQTWRLVKMTGSTTGSQWHGLDMHWQENYVFISDSTFIKTRVSDGQRQSVSGFYTYDSNSQNLLLNYEQANPLIGTCGSAFKETLYFAQNGETLLSNWWACDGPGLFYERID